jgi:CheY-like chemotaxis protein
MGNKVMVVDDEEDTRMLVKAILKKEGFEMSEAENGDDCLRKIDKSISVVLLDVMMPGITPKKVVEEIEKREDLRKVKILYFTVLNFPEEERKKILKG